MTLVAITARSGDSVELVVLGRGEGVDFVVDWAVGLAVGWAVVEADGV